MDWFEREFKKYALIRGGIYFFKEEIALKLIKKCKELNKKILGIDTFLITEKKKQTFILINNFF